MPRGPPVQGRGGHHFKRTLASFSLEGRVGVVTGGARGLGLVMSQAMLISGANIAIVDLNSMQVLQYHIPSLTVCRRRRREAGEVTDGALRQGEPRSPEVRHVLFRLR